MTQRVVILGAGMVGLALAHQLADGGILVDIVERQPSKASPRVSALNHSSKAYLAALNIWSELPRNSVSAFDRIDAWVQDHEGKISFDALSQQKLCLGHIVQNSAIVQVLWQHAEKHPNITLHCPASVDHYTVFEDHVAVHLSNAQTLSASVLVGADGARSWLRAQMQVACDLRQYGQQAIIATVHIEKTHHDTAFQSFLSTGPLGVLPLADPHQVSIVWSADDARATQLMEMKINVFECELATALNLRLGAMQLVTDRVVIPLVMRHAKHYVLPRLALIGDAAHTIHPLAGQGVNLGFKDAKVLGETILHAANQQKDFGRVSILKRYQTERRPDNQAMALIMLAFREAIRVPIASALVARGFNVIDQLPIIKKALMIR